MYVIVSEASDSKSKHALAVKIARGKHLDLAQRRGRIVNLPADKDAVVDALKALRGRLDRREALLHMGCACVTNVHQGVGHKRALCGAGVDSHRTTSLLVRGSAALPVTSVPD